MFGFNVTVCLLRFSRLTSEAFSGKVFSRAAHTCLKPIICCVGVDTHNCVPCWWRRGIQRCGYLVGLSRQRLLTGCGCCSWTSGGVGGGSHRRSQRRTGNWRQHVSRIMRGLKLWGLTESGSRKCKPATELGRTLAEHCPTHTLHLVFMDSCERHRHKSLRFPDKPNS